MDALVEMEKSPLNILASCAMPAADDENKTNTTLVEKARNEVSWSFSLANHPLDCPVLIKEGM